MHVVQASAFKSIRLGYTKLKNLIFQDVVRELAFTAPLCAYISTAESLRHAHDPDFRIQQCHIEIRNALTQLHNTASSPLANCLRSITLSDWSVVHSGILLWIQTAADEGDKPLLVLLLPHMPSIETPQAPAMQERICGRAIQNIMRRGTCCLFLEV